MAWTERVARCAGMIVALLLLGAGAAAAGTLDRIKADKAIRIAYREDAPPFSFKGKGGQPAGFMVELCGAVAKQLADQLGLPPLRVDYVKVTAENRFDAIAQGKADLLCEPTTQTLSRRKIVDFSLPTFVDGAGLMIRAGGPKTIKGLAGKKIGVLAGTTTEEELKNTLKDNGISAEVVPAKTHEEGLGLLDDGKIAAYFADRAILVFLAQQSAAPGKLLLAENYLTVEPYALALPHGDEDFRLAVDRSLSQIYSSGEIATIFKGTFGAKSKPTLILQTLYLISALPQ